MCTIPAIPVSLREPPALEEWEGPSGTKSVGSSVSWSDVSPGAPQAPVSSYLSCKLSLTAHAPAGNFHPADEARQISKQDCKFL